MFFRLSASTIALISISAASAYAQVTLDVSKVTCEQFYLAKASHPTTIGIWLSGFYNGKRNNTVLDVAQVKSNAEKVRRYCAKNLNSMVMEAAEKVIEGK